MVFRNNPEQRVRSISSFMKCQQQTKHKTINNKNMISIEMEFTIKNHPSLTMENKNENKKGFGWQRLWKRRTKQSEKHVTVYPLENGFQVTVNSGTQQEREGGDHQSAPWTQHNGGKKEKNKRWVKVLEIPGCR